MLIHRRFAGGLSAALLLCGLVATDDAWSQPAAPDTPPPAIPAESAPVPDPPATSGAAPLANPVPNPPATTSAAPLANDDGLRRWRQQQHLEAMRRESAMPSWYLAPPAMADPRLQAGVTTAAIGVTTLTAAGVFLGVGATRQPPCNLFTCSPEDGRFETTVGVMWLGAGLTNAAFSAALLVSHAQQPLAYPHRDTSLAAAGASLTSLASSALIGGAAGWLHGSFSRGGDELVPPLFLVLGGALLLPVGLPMWFAGSSPPTDLTNALEPREGRNGQMVDPMDAYRGPMVTRDPVMAATGAGLTALGGVGLATLIGTSIVVGNNDAALDDELTIVHMSVLGLSVSGLFAVGIPMLVLGSEQVPAPLSHAGREPNRWAPQVQVGAASASLHWTLD